MLHDNGCHGNHLGYAYQLPTSLPTGNALTFATRKLLDCHEPTGILLRVIIMWNLPYLDFTPDSKAKLESMGGSWSCKRFYEEVEGRRILISIAMLWLTVRKVPVFYRWHHPSRFCRPTYLCAVATVLYFNLFKVPQPAMLHLHVSIGVVTIEVIIISIIISFTSSSSSSSSSSSFKGAPFLLISFSSNFSPLTLHTFLCTI